jgi:Protein of unknown function (DUF2937)
MIANYLRLVVFSLGLLVGIQVPGFVDQYAKRVNAHYSEVVHNFAGFQDSANRYFGGSVEALIAHHVASADEVFKDEAKTIREMYERLTTLAAEREAMNTPLLKQIVHVMVRPNREILDETRAEYTYAVPLNAAAIVSGVTIGAVLAMLVESLVTGLGHLFRPRRHRSATSARAR